MKVLFDQGVPVPLRRELRGHRIDTLSERGWSQLGNGELLDAAEGAGYEVLVTTDQNLKHQQNQARRRLGTVVLLSTAWPKLRQRIPAIAAAVDAATPGTVVEVPV